MSSSAFRQVNKTVCGLKELLFHLAGEVTDSRSKVTSIVTQLGNAITG